jgi:hypothetical protein
MFHLEKLNAASLLQRQPSGEYVLLKRNKFGVMNAFIFVADRLVPKSLFYALLVSAATILTAVILCYLGQLVGALALLPAVIASVILWVEALQVWNAKPKFKGTPT